MNGKVKWILATAALAAVVFWLATSRDAAGPGAGQPQPSAVEGPKNDVPVRSRDRVVVESPSADADGDSLKVHQVLSAEGGSNENKLDELMSLMPNLGGEAQIEVAGHVSNLCEDDQVDRLIPLMKNTGVKFQARQVMFDALFNRGPDVSLPVLLRLAEGKDQLAEQARQSMQQLLGEDHGTDLSAWRKAVDEELEKYNTSEP